MYRKTPTQNTQQLTTQKTRQILANIPHNNELKAFISRMKTPRPFNIYDCQKFFETMYLLGLRTSETCGCNTQKNPNKPAGYTIKAEQATYTPDPTIMEELNTLTHLIYTQRLQEGNETTPTLKDILNIKEPIAYFYTKTIKRKDNYTRKTAIPLNTEPLAKNVLNYITQKQHNPPIFPINKYQALKLANITFKDHTYKIKAYMRSINGKKQLNPSSNKKVGDHALRHMRIEELKKLGIRGPYLKAFIGWTQNHDDELEDTYANEETYRCYIPFLLTAKIQTPTF